MEKLFKGIIQFRQQDLEKHKHLFKELGRQQKPHTLFIGCADSRIVPNLITATEPGELFTVRNIANIVPRYRKTEEYVSTTSAIEYAVQVLDVESIVVCGHSNCGGCAAMHSEPEDMAHIPHVSHWLEAAGPIRQKVEESMTGNSSEEREWLTEQINIVEQMKHLLTYPYIKERYKAGKLQILGWYYIIETGEIYNYNPEKSCFELVS